ncbi:MAG: glutamine synthetase III [Clostridia bacterium]|nr:glutamine synthetase III [Clostridia bacterium]
MTDITTIFGSRVFGDRQMKEYLPADVYERMKKTIYEGKSLDIDLANTVAEAMKEWAVSLGATHFTHWFQPMTGVTAEKHDSFVTLSSGGAAIMRFSGKELVRGESDASSFPSGGIRATFEARGYTAWDATSYAFVKGNTLCIPTVFCSYGGEALDKKTPLMRSLEALNTQCMRIMRIFGNDGVKRVYATVGAEQEYFLIDRELYKKREDLVFTGRTLFGNRPPKGQELDDHYYGSIKPRVAEFMRDLDEELWRLGIPSKTEHNEVAPSQHELAAIYTHVNTATDQNQLVMEMMKKVAARHGMACLLHEKPFSSVNGSGKHNNWSLATDTGANLLEPGDTPDENAQFLLFLCAVMEAIDRHQDLLRIAVSSAGNDLRLGSNEAPPVVISAYIGDELTEILESISSDKEYSRREQGVIRIGVHTLPKIPKDTTDRNRTSPVAFTGNKFEFRMLGSSFSLADINTVINTAVAESLDGIASRLEAASDTESEIHGIVRDLYTAHRRIVYGGNCYSAEWSEEAKKRGLSCFAKTPDAVVHLTDEKNVALFEKYRVFSRAELSSRRDVMLESYVKSIRIEALTMYDMAKKHIIPAIERYISLLCDAAEKKSGLIQARKAAVKRGMRDMVFSMEAEGETVEKLSWHSEDIYFSCEKLSVALQKLDATQDTAEQADFAKSGVLPIMEKLRAEADAAEAITDGSIWPFDSYSSLLFSIQ